MKVTNCMKKLTCIYRTQIQNYLLQPMLLKLTLDNLYFYENMITYLHQNEKFQSFGNRMILLILQLLAKKRVINSEQFLQLNLPLEQSNPLVTIVP